MLHCARAISRFPTPRTVLRSTMSKYLAVAALLALAACGPKAEQAPAADTTAAAATPAPAPAAADTTVKVAGDTAKKP